MINNTYTVLESFAGNTKRAFSICNAETQEPISGFDNLTMAPDIAKEYAKALSVCTSLEQCNSVAMLARQESMANESAISLT